RQLEASLLPHTLLDVRVLAFIRIDEAEVDPQRMVELPRVDDEGVVAEAIGCLDVVLIRARPVELHLLAFIRNSVDPGLVDALREEVASGVVPAKEAIEVLVDENIVRGVARAVLLGGRAREIPRLRQ